MKSISKKIQLSLLLIIASTSSFFAQETDPGFGTDGDPGAVPISDLVPFLLIMAFLFSLILTRRIYLVKIHEN